MNAHDHECRICFRRHAACCVDKALCDAASRVTIPCGRPACEHYDDPMNRHGEIAGE